MSETRIPSWQLLHGWAANKDGETTTGSTAAVVSFRADPTAFLIEAGPHLADAMSSPQRMQTATGARPLSEINRAFLHDKLDEWLNGFVQ